MWDLYRIKTYKSLFTFYLSTLFCKKLLLSYYWNYQMSLNFIMDITFASLIFASRTIPTDFGLVAAAIAGAGSLLFIALRFVPDAGN